MTQFGGVAGIVRFIPSARSSVGGTTATAVFLANMIRLNTPTCTHFVSSLYTHIAFVTFTTLPALHSRSIRPATSPNAHAFTTVSPSHIQHSNTSGVPARNIG